MHALGKSTADPALRPSNAIPPHSSRNGTPRTQICPAPSRRDAFTGSCKTSEQFAVGDSPHDDDDSTSGSTNRAAAAAWLDREAGKNMCVAAVSKSKDVWISPPGASRQRSCARNRRLVNLLDRALRQPAVFGRFADRPDTDVHYTHKKATSRA